MKCRKTIKEWQNGKLKILTRIASVKFVEENANGTITISFIDVDGSSVKARMKKGSAGREKIQPLLKGKRLEESVPKYPQFFLYDKEPFAGLWLSSSDCFEDVSSEVELRNTSLGEAGIHAKYEMVNPRVLSEAPVC
jgi:hypothetical protein